MFYNIQWYLYNKWKTTVLFGWFIMDHLSSMLRAVDWIYSQPFALSDFDKSDKKKKAFLARFNVEAGAHQMKRLVKWKGNLNDFKLQNLFQAGFMVMAFKDNTSYRWMQHLNPHTRNVCERIAMIWCLQVREGRVPSFFPHLSVMGSEFMAQIQEPHNWLSKITFNKLTGNYRVRRSRCWRQGPLLFPKSNNKGQAGSNADRQAENKMLESAECANHNLSSPLLSSVLFSSPWLFSCPTKPTIIYTL